MTTNGFGKVYHKHQQVLALHAGGKSVDQIAKATNYTHQSVLNILADAGIEVQRPRVVQTRFSSYRVLAELINTDVKYEAIGRRHGVSRQAVEQVAARAVDAGINLHPQRLKMRRHK